MPSVALNRRPSSNWRGRLLLLGIGALLLLLAYLDWPRVAVYWWKGQQTFGQRLSTLNLASYTASIDALPISGLTSNASGLTYSNSSDTLFTVINRPAAVAELSTDGELLRYIGLPWLSDPEGISHVADDLFVVSDEADHDLHWLRIGSGASIAQDVGRIPLPLRFRSLPNLGLEGVSWDETSDRLLLVNEKWPRKVLEVQGLTADPGQAGALSAEEWHPRTWLGLLGRDLASLTTVPANGNLLLLGEQSGLVTEYSRAGDVLGVLPLWRGFAGLKATVPQPEGVALGPNGALYVLSEPNLFYRFQPVSVPVGGDGDGQ